MADKYEWLLIGLCLGIPVGIIMFSILKPAASAATGSPRSTYNNLEEWELIRDERGLAVGVRAKRHAEQT